MALTAYESIDHTFDQLYFEYKAELTAYSELTQRVHDALGYDVLGTTDKTVGFELKYAPHPDPRYPWKRGELQVPAGWTHNPREDFLKPTFRGLGWQTAKALLECLQPPLSPLLFVEGMPQLIVPGTFDVHRPGFEERGGRVLVVWDLDVDDVPLTMRPDEKLWRRLLLND